MKRHILIVGLGNFGYHFARGLEGRVEVTAIDVSRDKIQRIGSCVDRAVVGDATDISVLRELGVESCDAAVVSTGQSMEASILTTLHLVSLGIKEIFVKAFSEEHSRILKLLGATRVVQPEKEVAENLAVTILRRNVIDYLRLHREFGILEIAAPEEFTQKSLQELQLRSRYHITVIGIFRGGNQFVNPLPDTVIHSGDRLVILGQENQILEFENRFIT